MILRDTDAPVTTPRARGARAGRRRLRTLTGLLVAGTLALGAGPAVAAAGDTGAVVGRVTADGAGIAGVRVLILPAVAGAQQYARTTTATGDFAVTSLPTGVYTFQVKDSSIANDVEQHVLVSKDAQATATIEVTRAPRPGNDDRAAAADLTFAGPVTATTRGATLESGEPRFSATDHGSLWWTYTAPETGWVTASTYGSRFDSTLLVLRDDAGALTTVASDDDSATPAPGDAAVPDDGMNAAVTFPVQAGATYLVRVAGADAFAYGDVRLRATRLASAELHVTTTLRLLPHASGATADVTITPVVPGTLRLSTGSTVVEGLGLTNGNRQYTLPLAPGTHHVTAELVPTDPTGLRIDVGHATITVPGAPTPTPDPTTPAPTPTTDPTVPAPPAPGPTAPAGPAPAAPGPAAPAGPAAPGPVATGLGATTPQATKKPKTKLAKKAKVAAPRFARGTRPRVTVTLGRLTTKKYPTGVVRIYVGSKVARTVKVATKHKGKITVTLPQRYRKTIKVKAVYAGNATTAASTSAAVKVRPR